LTEITLPSLNERVLCHSLLGLICSLSVLVSAGAEEATKPNVPLLSRVQGEMSGEATADSVVLQSRLTTGTYPYPVTQTASASGDVPGSPGVACFEISTHQDFADAFRTQWLLAVPERDFIVKTQVTGLKPGTRYYYRLVYGEDTEETEIGSRCTFKTLDGIDTESEASFVVVTGMNYARFHASYTGEDRMLGFPALETISRMRPDFFVGTGDNVYYDIPFMDEIVPEQFRRPPATRPAELRRKWHEQFAQPRFVKLFAETPTYWEIDDHDYRYNDCDTTSNVEPLPDLGLKIFLEQLPVTDPHALNPVTYRTHRVNRLLQIWLTEGRIHRSPNMMVDGPGKSMWGVEQREWLKRTLLGSDATFKILISPTPMIGPDDNVMPFPAYEGQDKFKRDNHSNTKGFKYERDEFFRWLIEYGLDKNHFYIVCGDRHWQYHSISREGIEEFSCGALVDANSRLGRKPGDPDSNDPEAKIKQPYTQDKESGGFLKVAVKPAVANKSAVLRFTWYDEHGVELYSTERMAD